MMQREMTDQGRCGTCTDAINFANISNDNFSGRPQPLTGNPGGQELALASSAIVSFDAVSEGTQLATMSVSESQEIINRKSNFRLSGAPNPINIHNNEEFARQNIFSGTVASGPAAMSYLDQMLQRSFPLSAFYQGGQLLMRAIEPFRAGDTVTFQGEITAKNAESAGRIRLASTDPTVQPDLDYNYLAHPNDLRRMRQAIHTAIGISQQPPFSDWVIERLNPVDADLATDDALDNWLLLNVCTQHHSSGTCKMGKASDAMAVVDQYCHVHGLEGLRVVDASVMPDVIRANTNATTIMIAERVADWIREGK